MSEAVKRLVFVAMAAPTGVAGHHYSMRDLARAFTAQRGWQVDIVLFSSSTGASGSVLEEFSPIFVQTGIGYGRAISALRSWTVERGADMVLAFDELSNRIATCAQFGRLQRLLPVKPGWVSNASWSAASAEFVVFSAEDLIFYRNHPKFARVHTNLITSRVGLPTVDQAKVDEIRTRSLAEHQARHLALCPVRIERGKDFFISAVLRAFEAEQAQSDTTLALLIIGAEQDATYRQELEARVTGLPISIFTEPRLTKSVSAVLPAGDIVYAMGRTAMEAILLGKRAFCPSGVAEAPLWEITPETFFAALSGNFTGRNDTRDLYQDIPSDPRDPDLHMEFSDMAQLAAAHMLSDAAVPHYEAAFERLLANPPTRIHQVRAWGYSRLRLLGIALKRKWQTLGHDAKNT